MKKTNTPTNSQSMAEPGNKKQSVTRVSSKEQPSQGSKTKKTASSARKDKAQQKIVSVLAKQSQEPNDAEVSRLIKTDDQGMSTFFLYSNRSHNLP